jgi:hypothetical protein
MLTLAAALAVTVLTGCVVAPYPAVATAPVDAGPVVTTPVAPPPPYVEVVPVMPFPGAIWIGGYWTWTGHAHSWIPGRWERPRPGYVWSPPRWEQRGGTWHQHPGYWHRR